MGERGSRRAVGGESSYDLSGVDHGAIAPGIRTGREGERSSDVGITHFWCGLMLLKI